MQPDSSSNSFEPSFELVCRMIFQGEKTIEACIELFQEIQERGYAVIPKSGIKYYAYRRLVEIGVLRVIEIPRCGLGKMYKRIVVNVRALFKLYNALQALKAPPICIEG